MSHTQEAKEANIKRIYYNLDEVRDEVWKAYISGLNYGQHKEFQKEIAEHDRAIQLFPDFALAYCARGLAYYMFIIPSELTNPSDEQSKVISLCCLNLYYALAIKPDVDGADVAREVLEVLLGENYWQKAKDYGEKMMRTDPDHAPPCLVFQKQAFDILAQRSSQVKTQQDKARIDAEIARLQRYPIYAIQIVKIERAKEAVIQEMEQEHRMPVTPAQQKPQPQQKKKHWWNG
jgi:tetratricopeptide (TPR) repeat protein